MKISSFSELSEKDVINLCTGEKLGKLCDLEIRTNDACVISLILPGQGTVLGFGKTTEIAIPWGKIECIGEDTVLVKLTPEELRCATKEQGKKQKNKQKM